MFHVISRSSVLLLGCMLLLFAFQNLWKEWGNSDFQIFTQNCQFHHWRLESLGYFNVLISFWALWSSFWTLKMPHYFYKVSLFIYSFVCEHFHFLHVCYVFNVIWRIHLMTDGLNVVWSNDRAAPTDTTPKNLELASPKVVMASRLDQ